MDEILASMLGQDLLEADQRETQAHARRYEIELVLRRQSMPPAARHQLQREHARLTSEVA